tara:strand:- start:136 stop:510 length:375 start_codon:yes stop_codon:yes gene_type:complete
MVIRILALLLGCCVPLSGSLASAGIGETSLQDWDICTFKDPKGSQPPEVNYISLGSSRDELIIADMVRRANHAGYANTAVQTIKLSQENTWYIVSVGPYADKGKLDEDERVLHQLGFHPVPSPY